MVRVFNKNNFGIGTNKGNCPRIIAFFLFLTFTFSHSMKQLAGIRSYNPVVRNEWSKDVFVPKDQAIKTTCEHGHIIQITNGSAVGCAFECYCSTGQLVLVGNNKDTNVTIKHIPVEPLVFNVSLEYDWEPALSIMRDYGVDVLLFGHSVQSEPFSVAEVYAPQPIILPYDRITLIYAVVILSIPFIFYVWLLIQYICEKKKVHKTPFAKVTVKSKRNYRRVVIFNSTFSAFLSIAMFFYLARGVNSLEIIDYNTHMRIYNCPYNYMYVNDNCYRVNTADSLCGDLDCYTAGICYSKTSGSCTVRMPDVNAVESEMCSCLSKDSGVLHCTTPCGFNLTIGNSTKYHFMLNKGLGAVGSEVLFVKLKSIEKFTRDTCYGGSTAPEEICSGKNFPGVVVGDYQHCIGLNCAKPFYEHYCFALTGHKLCKAVHYNIDYIKKSFVMSSVTNYNQPTVVSMDPMDPEKLQQITIDVDMFSNIGSFPNGVLLASSSSYYPITSGGQLTSDSAFIVYKSDAEYNAFKSLMDNGCDARKLWNTPNYDLLRRRMIMHRKIVFADNEYRENGHSYSSLERLVPSHKAIECKLSSYITGTGSCHIERIGERVYGYGWLKWRNNEGRIEDAYMSVMLDKQLVSPISKVAYPADSWTELDVRDMPYLRYLFSSGTPKPLPPTASPLPTNVPPPPSPTPGPSMTPVVCPYACNNCNSAGVCLKCNQGWDLVNGICDCDIRRSCAAINCTHGDWVCDYTRNQDSCGAYRCRRCSRGLCSGLMKDEPSSCRIYIDFSVSASDFNFVDLISHGCVDDYSGQVLPNTSMSNISEVDYDYLALMRILTKSVIFKILIGLASVAVFILIVALLCCGVKAAQKSKKRKKRNNNRFYYTPN